MTTMTVEIPATIFIARPQGEVEAAEELARRINATAGRFEDFDETATASAQVASWWGPASEAYAGAARDAAADHASGASALQQVGRACLAYADTLQDLLQVHERLLDDKAGLDERRRQLIADVDAAVDVEESHIIVLRVRAGQLRSDYDELAAEADDLQRRAQDNEDLLRAAFERNDTMAEIRSGAVDPAVEAAMGRPGAPGSGAGPEAVNDWWNDLDPAVQEALIAAYPDVLGRSDGLPATVRDQANRISLAADLASLGAKDEDGTLTSLERRALENAEAADRALTRADSYEDPITGENPGGQLWLYDPTAFDGDGRVAVAVGDLDTAEDVAIRVPGITNDGTKAVGLTNEAINVYQSARYEGDGSSVASMMWLGYDAPGQVDPATLTEGRAEDGGRRFADAVEGFQATRRDDPAHLTAIGHSYGSTTVAKAASEHGIDVDNIVLVGSPGAGGGVDHASQLGVGEDNVFVGRNSRDVVAVLGDKGAFGAGTLFGAGLGNDPSEDAFGAVRFQAEDIDRSWHRGIAQHGQHFRPNSESLYNIGRIVDGQADAVNRAEHSYDPWLGSPRDPEWDREPAPEDTPNRSATGGDR